jgi:hypothetical protein
MAEQSHSILFACLVHIIGLIILFIWLPAYLYYNKKYKTALKKEIEDFNKRWE